MVSKLTIRFKTHMRLGIQEKAGSVSELEGADLNLAFLQKVGSLADNLIILKFLPSLISIL